MSATILRVTYGIDETLPNRDFPSQVEEAMRHISTAPGAFLVDVIPLRELSTLCISLPILIISLHASEVKYVPSWFPFAGFKSYGEFW